MTSARSPMCAPRLSPSPTAHGKRTSCPCQHLLPDTKAGENAPEQVLTAEFASDLIEGLLSQAQLLRDQLSGTPLPQQSRCVIHAIAGACEGIEMALAGGHGA